MFDTKLIISLSQYFKGMDKPVHKLSEMFLGKYFTSESQSLFIRCPIELISILSKAEYLEALIAKKMVRLNSK
jgi:hypothetical protein